MLIVIKSYLCEEISMRRYDYKLNMKLENMGLWYKDKNLNYEREPYRHH